MSSSEARQVASPGGATAPALRSQSWLRVAGAMIALGWGGNQYLPLMPLYRSLVGYTPLEVDLFLACYVFGLVPGFVAAGRWSNRFGRKPVILAGLVASVLGSVVLALADGSVPGMCAGRLLSGVGVASGMVAGSSWVKELAERHGQARLGARRAALALSIGFGGGAGIAGVLAQWAPDPTVVPYTVHIAACIAAVLVIVATPNTRAVTTAGRSMLLDLRVPTNVARTFWTGVAPTAPWIFGAAALSFALGPSLVQQSTGSYQVAFATSITVITLGVGTATQLLSGRIDRALRGRSGPVGALCVALGALILVHAAASDSAVVVLAAAPLFGCGYGLCMVSGLAAVQAMATPGELAGLTAVFYALSYAGFFIPILFAVLAPLADAQELLLIVAVLILICAGVSARALRDPVAPRS